MKTLQNAMMAFVTATVVLTPVVTSATRAFASTTVSVPATQVVAEAPITAGPSRSECLAPNFDDTGLTALQAAVNSFDTLTNSTVTCLTAYLNGATTWSQWDSPWIDQSQYGYTEWVTDDPQSRQLVLQVDLIPTDLEDESDPLGWEQTCAAGGFDADATELGTNLVAAGLGNSVIRLGAEMNGTWETDFIGTTTQEQNLWATCFANEVTSLRQASGEHFLIDWDVNACKGAYPYANFYPGNAYVDIVGLDLYDVDCDTPNNSVTFSQLANEPFGLTDFETFAAAQGKPMSFPEWGLQPTPSADDPGFIDGMASTVANENVAFESYFDVNVVIRPYLPLGPQTPLSLTSFQEWFGTTTSGATSISGTVLAIGGSALAGVCAEAFLNGTQLAASATTTANGTYSITGLPPGNYGVEFVPGCGGEDFASQWYNATASGTLSAPGTLLDPTLASPTTGVNATMSAGTSIAGTVSAAAGGADLSGVCVDAFPVGGTSSAGTTGITAADGTYMVEGLAPGSYDVEFLAGSCAGNYVTQWYDDTSTGAASESDASALNVMSPETGINAEMALAATISGTVTGAVNGSNVANVCLSITSTYGGSGGSTISSADGVYVVSGLAAGSYEIAVDPSCGGTVTSSYASPQPPSGAVDVTTGGTSIYDVGLVLPRSITDVITPTTTAPTDAVVGGATYSPSATATSGDIVQITVDVLSTGCTLTAGVVNFTAAGVCYVDFNDPTSGTKDPYASAIQVQQPFVVAASSGGGGGGGGGGGSGGGGGGGGDGGGGTPQSPPVTTTTVLPAAPPTPVATIPTPREVTYARNSDTLSLDAKDVLRALAKKLSAGGSITVIGFAHNDRALARRRADVVANFLVQHVSVHVTTKFETTSTVDKVMVVTTKV